MEKKRHKTESKTNNLKMMLTETSGEEKRMQKIISREKNLTELIVLKS